ncbi:Copia protein [Sesamum angolense]|uniref:Copia protein n=1 Tax=Sesamum angolense TaxID=2727404 RepID=A0AAE1T505_9LAMI|nr:Copia protein [Sesamum angolense]
MRSTRESRQLDRYGFLGLNSEMDNDLMTYGEAMSNIDSDKWLEAMRSEMESIGSNQVWTLVDPPKHVKPARCKWVYKCKLGEAGEVTAFKARLVAKGYTQHLRVDFEKIYSPAAMAKSIQILFAITPWYDYEIWKMVVKMIFLNDFLEKENYMDQSEGFTFIGVEQKICRLQRSIYGFIKASRTWNTCFNEVIWSYNFIKNEYDPPEDQWEHGCISGMQWEGPLKRTKDMFLIYGGGELILEGYSDTSFPLDDDDAKSQSGFVFKMNGGVVAWNSSKQATTNDSTTKAEYIAVSKAAKEAFG